MRHDCGLSPLYTSTGLLHITQVGKAGSPYMMRMDGWMAVDEELMAVIMPACRGNSASPSLSRPVLTHDRHSWSPFAHSTRNYTRIWPPSWASMQARPGGKIGTTSSCRWHNAQNKSRYVQRYRYSTIGHHSTFPHLQKTFLQPCIVHVNESWLVLVLLKI